MLALSWLVLSLTAAAGDYYIEGPALRSKVDAAEMARVAAAAGQRARVVRRYRHGGGWEYALLVEGFTEEAAAARAANQLAAATGRAISIFSVDGDRATPVSVPELRGLAGEGEAEPVDGPAEVLRRASRAHGGTDGGIVAVETAESVLFRFRRSAPGGLVVEHVYGRRGTALHLEVRVVEGNGVDSVTTVNSEGAWLEQAGRPLVQLNRDRAASTIGRFAPAAVFGAALSLVRDIQTRPLLASLRMDTSTKVDGTPCSVLRHDGDRLNQPLSMTISEIDWTLRQFAPGHGVRFEYSDYREVDAGLSVPFALRTWRFHELLDEVDVRELDIVPVLAEEWFAVPKSQWPENGAPLP